MSLLESLDQRICYDPVELTVVRREKINDCVVGDLLVNGAFICNTLEPCYNRLYPCIPEGDYRCYVSWSERFEDWRVFVDVEKRSGIEFHAGNTVEDTLGCILLGDLAQDSKGNSRPYLMYSRLAVGRFMKNFLPDFLDRPEYKTRINLAVYDLYMLDKK